MTMSPRFIFSSALLVSLHTNTVFGWVQSLDEATGLRAPALTPMNRQYSLEQGGENPQVRDVNIREPGKHSFSFDLVEEREGVLREEYLSTWTEDFLEDDEVDMYYAEYKIASGVSRYMPFGMYHCAMTFTNRRQRSAENEKNTGKSAIRSRDIHYTIEYYATNTEEGASFIFPKFVKAQTKNIAVQLIDLIDSSGVDGYVPDLVMSPVYSSLSYLSMGIDYMTGALADRTQWNLPGQLHLISERSADYEHFVHMGVVSVPQLKLAIQASIEWNRQGTRFEIPSVFSPTEVLFEKLKEMKNGATDLKNQIFLHENPSIENVENEIKRHERLGYYRPLPGRLCSDLFEFTCTKLMLAGAELRPARPIYKDVFHFSTRHIEALGPIPSLSAKAKRDLVRYLRFLNTFRLYEANPGLMIRVFLSALSVAKLPVFIEKRDTIVKFLYERIEDMNFCYNEVAFGEHGTYVDLDSPKRFCLVTDTSQLSQVQTSAGETITVLPYTSMSANFTSYQWAVYIEQKVDDWVCEVFDALPLVSLVASLITAGVILGVRRLKPLQSVHIKRE